MLRDTPWTLSVSCHPQQRLRASMCAATFATTASSVLRSASIRRRKLQFQQQQRLCPISLSRLLAGNGNGNGNDDDDNAFCTTFVATTLSLRCVVATYTNDERLCSDITHSLYTLKPQTPSSMLACTSSMSIVHSFVSEVYGRSTHCTVAERCKVK